MIDCLYVGLMKYLVINANNNNKSYRDKGYLTFYFLNKDRIEAYGHLVNLNTWYNILIEKKMNKLNRRVRWKTGSVES